MSSYGIGRKQKRIILLQKWNGRMHICHSVCCKMFNARNIQIMNWFFAGEKLTKIRGNNKTQLCDSSYINLLQKNKIQMFKMTQNSYPDKLRFASNFCILSV